MSDSDKFLSGNPFSINELACYQASQQISAYHARPTQTSWGLVCKETQLVFKLSIVAICHQMNWEFLQSRLAEKLLTQKKDFVQTIANVTSRDITEWFGDYHRPERIRAKERARLLRDVGKTLQEKWDSRVSAILEAGDGRLEGKKGFLQLLDDFVAYREDPLRKKSNVLVHDLVRERIITFTDMEKIKPAIDYHLIRLYLRTGRVTPLYEAVKEQLKGIPRPRPRLVRLLRATVADALRLTAQYSALTIPDVNYIEWQIGRSICHNKNPQCISLESAPSLAEDVAILFSSKCPYDNYCWAFSKDREWLHLQEPKYEKSYY